MIDVFLISYILIFITILFNSYFFPNLDPHIRFILILLMLVIIINKLNSDYIELFLSENQQSDIDNIINSNNFKKVTVLGNLSVNGSATVNGMTNIQNGGVLNVGSIPDSGLKLTGTNGSSVIFYQIPLLNIITATHYNKNA